MQDRLLVAVVQLHSTPDRADNLRRAEQFLAEAARAGAHLAVLPELFAQLGPLADVAAAAEPIPGPTSHWASDQAARHGLVLCAGSLPELRPGGERPYNTCPVFDANGALRARYRKRRLFDVAWGERLATTESRYFSAGDESAAFAAAGAQCGVAICYDLRFPELSGELADQGLELLLAPAAFTRATGQDHWKLLVRSRAIETQAFVAAANQVGEHGGSLTSFGHSMIVDPWGDVLAEADGHSETLLLAELTAARLDAVRRRLAVLAQRRK